MERIKRIKDKMREKSVDRDWERSRVSHRNYPGINL